MSHRFRLFTILVILGVLGILGKVGETRDLFVSVDGSDTNPGTRAKPFASLTRARDAVRRDIASGLDSNVTVTIGEGTYELSEPLQFGPLDSGTEHSITYQAEAGKRVVLDGGRRIVGWKQANGPIWSAPVPEAKEGGWGFRNLFVNGRRASRARTPNHDASPNGWQLKAVEWSDDPQRLALILPPGLLPDVHDASDMSDMEVMIAGNWAINRKRVESLDAKSNRAVLSPPHRHGPAYIFPSAGRWCHFENARALLDQPGEWYLDRKKGELLYWPLPNEPMTKIEVFAPFAQQLLVVRGESKKPVRNLHFRGIRFEHSDWQIPPDGYMGIQACHFGKSDAPGRRWNRIPSAVFLSDAQGCRVENCTLSHLGGSGIELADGCRDCLVEGNHLFDISANGIMVAGPSIEDRVPVGNRVRNNHVEACGQEYFGAIGIWVGFTQGTRVSHNLVHDLPYSGISIGWEWNERPTPCKKNTVESNHVYDVMNRLCDGGCLYTLGLQPDTIVRDNYFHAVHRSPMAQGAPNNGMFIDQGSKSYRFERNVIHDTHDQPVRFNQCQREWHTWIENHIGDEATVKRKGKEIIEQAGLEMPWREAHALDEPSSDLSIVSEMGPVIARKYLVHGKSWSQKDDVALAEPIAHARAEWRKKSPRLAKRLTVERVRSLSRWAKSQMEEYTSVSPLENVVLNPIGINTERTMLVLEGTIDTLPTHSPLVTRWLRVYLLYDVQAKRVAHVTLTIRGEVLE